MFDRRMQIEELMHTFYTLRNGLVKGAFILSDKNRIPNSQWIVLRTIHRNEGMGIKELAEILGISSSAATQLVDSLVAKSYLVREASADDRRAIKIRLSDKTRELINSVDIEAFRKVNSVFDVLSDEELKLYSELSKKVAKNISNILEKQVSE